MTFEKWWAENLEGKGVEAAKAIALLSWVAATELNHARVGPYHIVDMHGRVWLWRTSLWQRIRRFFGFSCSSYPVPLEIKE